MDLAVSFVLASFLILAREILFRLFTSDADVISIGCDMLLYIAPWYIVYVFIEILGGSLRGRGNVIVPVVITLFWRMRPADHLAGRRTEAVADDPRHHPELSGDLGGHRAGIYRILYFKRQKGSLIYFHVFGPQEISVDISEFPFRCLIRPARHADPVRTPIRLRAFIPPVAHRTLCLCGQRGSICRTDMQKPAVFRIQEVDPHNHCHQHGVLIPPLRAR